MNYLSFFIFALFFFKFSKCSLSLLSVIIINPNMEHNETATTIPKIIPKCLIYQGGGAFFFAATIIGTEAIINNNRIIDI